MVSVFSPWESLRKKGVGCREERVIIKVRVGGEGREKVEGGGES